MRRGSHGKGIVRLEDGTLLGVNLGADFTAEHEWGIKDIRRTYGIDDADEGVGRRQIRTFPEGNLMRGSVSLKVTDYSERKRKASTDTWHGLVSFRYYDSERKHWPELSETMVRQFELAPYGSDDFCGAWDGGSFGLLAKDEAVVTQLYDAIVQLDLCIGLFNGESWNPFSRSGLGLLIASRVPQSVRDQWLESDRDGRRLVEAAKATGIADRLEKAGLRYYALSPKWATGMRGEPPETKHPVVYWLNPQEQDRHNHGWFTVEQLDQWIKGRGPIPKRADAA